MHIDEQTWPEIERCRSENSLRSTAERHLLSTDWNCTERDYPRDRCIHELFEAQAQRTPQAVAAMSIAEALTYRELATRSERFALYLHSLGVGQSWSVGASSARSIC
jgi:non-ribosomal peptide synthetase component F